VQLIAQAFSKALLPKGVCEFYMNSTLHAANWHVFNRAGACAAFALAAEMHFMPVCHEWPLADLGADRV
jgi:hypothetical protein